MGGGRRKKIASASLRACVRLAAQGSGGAGLPLPACPAREGALQAGGALHAGGCSLGGGRERGVCSAWALWRRRSGGC